nr:ER membrane protein DP1/Yop1 [Polyrhizophydium stewartii]
MADAPPPPAGAAPKPAPKTLSARVKAIADKIEKLLSKVPQLEELAKSLKVSKLYCMVLTLAAVVWAALVFKNIAASALTDLVGFSYPAYASLKAVDSGDKAKVVFGIFKTLENFHIILLKILPFYFPIKSAFLYWAMSKRTMGASMVYQGVFKHGIPLLDKTFGSMLGGVMSEAVKASAEAPAKSAEAPKPPQQQPTPVPATPPPVLTRTGQITLTAPGVNFRPANNRRRYTSLGFVVR